MSVRDVIQEFWVSMHSLQSKTNKEKRDAFELEIGLKITWSIAPRLYKQTDGWSCDIFIVKHLMEVLLGIAPTSSQISPRKIKEMMYHFFAQHAFVKSSKDGDDSEPEIIQNTDGRNDTPLLAIEMDSIYERAIKKHLGSIQK